MKISIKVKLTVFLILLLIFNLIIISIFTLNGVKENQKESYEIFLKDNSKTANLYIREKFLVTKSKDFEKFYIENASKISLELARMLDLKTVLYDNNGNVISNIQNLIDNNDNTKLLSKALENNIVYQKEGDRIIYAAPVYDLEKQIGVLKFEYSIKKQRIFYEDIRKLFLKVGLVSIIVTFILARLYFIDIVKSIIILKESIKNVEKGNYDCIEIINRSDEFGELGKGILAMSKKIKNNINQINNEKKKLKKALVKLQKLEKRQREFIGDITHEFKTPITVIKAQIDLITLYNDDENMVNKSKEIAEKELKRLDSMIENILYLSRTEKYDFELKRRKINTKIILKEIIERMTGKASKYGIEIIENIKEACVYMDYDSFMQIFINLIDNAIKYNNIDGKIFIRSYIIDNKNYIEIEDTGIGIPNEHKRRIFEPFYTIEKNRSKKFSGTGLGLALVYKLLEKQNAAISVLDGDKGTIFKVKIPLYKDINGNDD
ncbi:sensor histidine kinase [Abyssisolibacter fermentans]|uniref:sensor histidine kinase n=1 Tax=Abyssisolibacter fermentans TaxID=1766203 RepID=UPI00082A7850|nr:HAMP domain-containing sensor histidine kinase [Abyssisolibacter fermentans]